MNREIKTIDISETPELLRLAEEVAASMQPRSLQRHGETLVVVMPVASKRPTRVPTAPARAAIARLRATHGSVEPRSRPEDFRALRDEFEEGVAEEVVAETP